MPALMNHFFLGETVIPQLEKGFVESVEEREAFLIGCQGPDPFFFRWSCLIPEKISASNELGNRMHNTRMSLFFERLRDACRFIPSADRDVARAFALGMLCHYALDRVGHPFIYAKQYEILRAGVGLENSGNQVHALIESELDSAMLMRLRGLTTREFTPASCLPLSAHVGKVAGTLLSQAVLATYDESIEPSLYATCVNDMRLLYQVVEPYGSWREQLIRELETAVRNGTHSLVSALMHQTVASSASPSMNDEHYEWRDIWSNAVSTDSFEDRFNLAAESFPALASAYLAGEDTAALTAHVNYLGTLMEDENTKIPYPEV